MEKYIKSVIEVGDEIEIEEYSKTNPTRSIVRVNNIEVILDNPHTRPINICIHVDFLYKINGKFGPSRVMYTSDNFKYIRHVDRNTIIDQILK